MYGLGNSLRDIPAYIEEMYDSKISTHVLSDITDRVVPKVKVMARATLAAIPAIGRKSQAPDPKHNAENFSYNEAEAPNYHKVLW